MERIISETEFENYCQKILEEELLRAMGCTEPIALAYCAALARKTLGTIPERVIVEASGNIIKNVKSVIVPNTGGLKGIPAAAAAGIAAGREDLILEVISKVDDAGRVQIRDFLERVPIEVKVLESEDRLDMIVRVEGSGHTAMARISGTHSHITCLARDGKILQADGTAGCRKNAGTSEDPRAFLTVERILHYAETVDVAKVKPVLDVQIDCNMAIAEEGLKNSWGANVGSIIESQNPSDLRNHAKAMAAAGSDARMSGCSLPVVINSGSGNQGITVSVPVVVYARGMHAGEEAMYRALLVSNLISIHVKHGIGSLSAFCGAVSAGCAAGCGIAYLEGGRLDAIAHTLVNALAIVSGIVCDGAKPSCAAKIASSLDAGFLGYDMYLHHEQFYGGDGIISKGVENTIANIARLGSQGMSGTDKEILDIMTGTSCL